MTAFDAQERNASLDLVKVVACFLVILVHVTGVNLVDINSPGWAVTNVYESFARVCVPLFFMASGATLLTRDYALVDFLRRRFLRILPPLIFWSAAYVIYYDLRKGLDAWTRLSMIPWKPAATHLWYLYALIGIYPFVPFFAKIFRNSDKSEKIYFLVLWFIFSTVSAISRERLPNKAEPISILPCFDQWIYRILFSWSFLCRNRAQWKSDIAFDGASYIHRCRAGNYLSDTERFIRCRTLGGRISNVPDATCRHWVVRPVHLNSHAKGEASKVALKLCRLLAWGLLYTCHHT